MMVKRFYKEVSTEDRDGLWVVLLDGKIAKTAGRHELGANSPALAMALAQEWVAQEGELDASTMPLTRLQGFVLDGDQQGKAEWAEKILAFAKSDLLCYRAEDTDLARRQAEHWQPVLDAVGLSCGSQFNVTEGIVAVDQSDELLAGLEKRLHELPVGVVLALKLLTEMTGSAALALAVADNVLPPDKAFDISRIDERYQEEKWGVDSEAAAREAAIRGEFHTVFKFLELSR